VDTETKAGKLLLKAYDGDLSDIEALKLEASELGALRGEATLVLPQNSDPGQGGQTQNLETGSGARQELAGGSPLDPNQKKPVEQEAREAYETAIKAQASDDDASAAWFGVKVNRKAEELGLKANG
jgi:hypothetical protein